jgi:hypothetical protein
VVSGRSGVIQIVCCTGCVERSMLQRVNVPLPRTRPLSRGRISGDVKSCKQKLRNKISEQMTESNKRHLGSCHLRKRHSFHTCLCSGLFWVAASQIASQVSLAAGAALGRFLRIKVRVGNGGVEVERVGSSGLVRMVGCNFL